MTPKDWGSVFRKLREESNLTQQQTADRLQECGVKITSRFGISHLEDRGTQQYQIISAYSKIFNKSLEQLEEMIIDVPSELLPV